MPIAICSLMSALDLIIMAEKAKIGQIGLFTCGIENNGTGSID